jgi:TRAP-type C4-dicarboxylate transport system permease small subunit
VAVMSGDAGQIQDLIFATKDINMNQQPSKNSLIRWISAIDRLLEKILGAIMAAILLLLGIMVFVTVILRYGFSYSIFGMHESLPIFFAHVTAIGAALAISQRGHISVPALFEILPENLTRYLDVLVFLFLILINAAIFWQSILWLEKTGFFMMHSIRVPQIVAKISIPIATGLSILFCIIRIVLVLFGGEKPSWFTAKG